MRLHKEEIIWRKDYIKKELYGKETTRRDLLLIIINISIFDLWIF